MREITHCRPERLPQLGLLGGCQWRLPGIGPLIARGLRALRRKLFGKQVPSTPQRSLPAEFDTEGGDDGVDDLVACHGAGALADRFIKQFLNLREARNARRGLPLRNRIPSVPDQFVVIAAAAAVFECVGNVYAFKWKNVVSPWFADDVEVIFICHYHPLQMLTR